jgi:hypothetical protein
MDISNNHSFGLKHLGVVHGSDCSDGTSYSVKENCPPPVGYAMDRVACSPPLVCVWYTHHQNDMCVTLFAGAEVVL